MAGEPEWTYDRHDKASTDDAGPHATRRTDSAMTIASSGALGGCLRMNPLAPGGVTVDIKLARSDRVFHAGEALVGEVVLTSSSGPVHHNGLRVTASGSVQMRVSERAVGVFEAFFLNVRPVPLLSETLEVVAPGVCPEGVTRFPFSLPLRPHPENPATPLFETYHGINVNVQYGVAAELERSLVRGGKLSTGLIEFIIEERGGAREDQACSASKPIEFSLLPDEESQQYEGARLSSTALRITGRLDHGTVSIQRPVSGTMRVEHCELPLKSIELTLGRVEWCTVGDHSNSVAREATDIQCTQVADGDVARGVELPIHLVLPRLYTCPSANTETWGVEFELAVSAVVEGPGGFATASVRLPLRLVRGRRVSSEPA